VSTDADGVVDCDADDVSGGGDDGDMGASKEEDEEERWLL